MRVPASATRTPEQVPEAYVPSRRPPRASKAAGRRRAGILNFGARQLCLAWEASLSRIGALSLLRALQHLLCINSSALRDLWATPHAALTKLTAPKHTKTLFSCARCTLPPTTKRERTPAAAPTAHERMAANLNAQLEQEAGEELQAYKTLQGHVEQLLQSRGRFIQQRVENEAVRDELALDEGATVYKTVGPVLFKQDYDEVKENVAKRLEFIAKEVQKVDDQVKAKQDEQQKIGELIMKKQNDLRQKAAEEAKKVYEEQMAKQA